MDQHEVAPPAFSDHCLLVASSPVTASMVWAACPVADPVGDPELDEVPELVEWAEGSSPKSLSLSNAPNGAYRREGRGEGYSFLIPKPFFPSCQFASVPPGHLRCICPANQH